MANGIASDAGENTSAAGLRPKLRARAAELAQQCKIEQLAYGRWLDRLTPLRWFTSISGIVLPILAGATVVGQNSFGDRWPALAGVFAFAAALVNAVHMGLKCDAHQAECIRLIKVFRRLENDFGEVKTIPPARLEQRVRELEAQFKAAGEDATATPSARSREKAERHVISLQPRDLDGTR